MSTTAARAGKANDMGLITRLWQRARGLPGRGIDRTIQGTALGSDYGGYVVHVDGLNAASVVYSVGVGEDMTFDVALIERFGMTVHAFDPTPRSRQFIERTQPKNVVFHDYGVFDHDGVVRFNPPKNPAHVSMSVLDETVSDRITASGGTEFAVRTIPSIMQELGHTRIDVLKMDIEGAEYNVIDHLAQHKPEVRQLMVEFHHVLPGIPVARTERAIDQLADLGFRPFAVSKSGLEWSFLNLGA